MSSTEVIAFDQRFGINSIDNNQRTDLYKCHMCCKTYKLQSSLVRHIKYECGKPPQFHCPYCTEKSHHKYNLEVHIKRKHKQVQESLIYFFFIAVVNASWTENALPSQLRTTNLGAAGMQTMLHDFDRNDKFHRMEPFVCSTCGRQYSRKDSLQRHVKYECGVEPQFYCPYCPERSRHKSNLRRHIILRHHSNVPWCDIV
ncbi:zinc finger protein 64-like [Schistocerca americana]|uniref:zinc finger protein 64-like n=1 Tax=Schistocerca americana TaxID=7009 RepID=UPI001F4F4286|nr:zinc finger protein 64-like [Schistocerca americana]